MIKKNIYLEPKSEENAHDGEGKINFCRPFTSADFQSNLSFIDYVEIPPGSSIGIHLHGKNEEIYFIVEGKGTMTTNGKSYEVSSGDLIVNKENWEHGFYNSSDSIVKILVWEIAF